MSVSKSRSFRITGTADELDGFIRSLEWLDRLELVSIRRYERTAALVDELRFDTAEQITMDLSFGMALGAHATYDLVMNQFRNFHGEALHMKIEPVNDDAEADS